jgi:hypothetical protein
MVANGSVALLRPRLPNATSSWQAGSPTRHSRSDDTVEGLALYHQHMVWSELALLGAGAVVGQAGSLIQRRADRKDRREELAEAGRTARESRAENQTRAALLEIAVRLQDLSAAAEQRADNLEDQVAATIHVLRRQGLLVADADLRERVGLARDCLEWRNAIANSPLGAGIVYLTRYIVGDLEPAIGAYVRHEPIRRAASAWTTARKCSTPSGPRASTANGSDHRSGRLRHARGY